ncbi:polyphosphate polymerase domain-containing protein [Paenibacillus albus]|uniref:Polyphosphate polymerase domain-containing protein n=1 Tax=Paenibacillus albus TaxID=2495582 RepID=A0A3Q8X3F5_9BACL|nr:polyphosphate polymerase domain-containing protein [Paenibacillus albus]AZN39577.1 polyphosphate polymerase domain-containing protein [Paenibacillus albus]
MEFQGRKLRNEYKYYIHLHEYMTLRHRLTKIMNMDEYSIDGEGYGIRSLYFDGYQNHSLYDKNNGVFKRDKYRIRIYNGQDDRITLERKSKYGDYIAKEGAALSRKEYEALLVGDAQCLKDKDNLLCNEFYHAVTNRAFRPTVIVDYTREAYVYPHGNVRVTFDKRVSAGVNTIDLFDDNLALEEAISGPITVMEVKFDSYLPDFVRKVVQPDHYVRSAISKYVICRESKYKHHKE